MRKNFWFQLCLLLFFIVGGFTIFGSLAALLQLVLKLDTTSRTYFYMVQFISALGIFFCPAMLFSYCTSQKWFSYSAANQKVSLPLVGYVLILSLLILPVVVCLEYFNEQLSLPESLKKIEMWMQKMEENGKFVTQTLTAHSTIPILLVNLLLMAFLPAIFEEFFFRGTLQSFFVKWFGNKAVAIILTAFIFSAIHFQFYGFLPRFLLGIYLGYLLIWGKSLWLPITAHLTHNAASLILDYVAQQKKIDLEAVKPEDISGFYPVVLASLVCVGIGIYWIRKRYLCTSLTNFSTSNTPP